MGLNDPYTKQFGETDAQFRERMVRLASAPVVVFNQPEPLSTIPPAVREAAVRLNDWYQNNDKDRIEHKGNEHPWMREEINVYGNAHARDILLICQHVLGRDDKS